MPFTNAVAPATVLPATAALYQMMLLPVTEIFETLGLLALQNDCEAPPVGADGLAFTVTVTGATTKAPKLVVPFI